MRSPRCSVLLAPLLLLGADASPLEQRGSSCNANNCYRQVFASNYPSRPTRADCSSFLGTTITPATVTFTSTATVTDTAYLTESDTVTGTKVATDTVYTTVTITSTPSVSSPSTVVPEKRAVASIPAYASGCSSAAAYSSACSCLGIQPFTVTAVAPLTTVVVTTTASATVVATALSSITITEHVTVTSTATTVAVALATATNCAPPSFSPAACLVNVPYYCTRLPGLTVGQAQQDWRPSVLQACQSDWRSVPALWAQVQSCFPVSPSTTDPTPAAPILDCVLAQGICHFTPECTTETYPVGGTPTGTPAPAPTNVLVNGGFEDGTVAPFAFGEQFVIQHPLQVSVTSDNPHTGSNSLKVVFDNADGEGVGMSQTFKVQPNATYTFSAWYYQTNANSYCAFNVQSLPGALLGQFLLTNQPTGRWVQVQQSFKAPATDLWLSVYFSCNAGGGPPYANNPNFMNTYWLDDLSLTMVSY